MSSQSPTEDHLRDGPARDVNGHKDDIQPPGEKATRRRRQARIPALSLAAALVFFFGPAIAFVFGDRAAPIENRPLAGMPSLNSGWQLIPRFNAWAVDHLPLRAQAVRANTNLSEAVFGEPPLSGNQTTSGIGSVAAGNAAPDTAGSGTSISAAPRVIQGKNDWLFLDDDFSSACNAKVGLPEVFDGLNRLRTAVESSGRKLVISVIPDKSTAVSWQLPDNYAFKKCSEERRKEFWKKNATSKEPFFDLRGTMEMAAHAAQHSMYLRLNTHWNITGAAVWTKSVLATLDPKLIEGMTIPEVDKGAPSSDSPFVAGPMTTMLGDLTVMLGAPRKEPMHGIAVRRKGVTLSSNGVPLPGNVPPQMQSGAIGVAATPTKIEASTTAAPLYPGHTLFLGDSFYSIFGGLAFAPFMSNLTSVYVLADPASFTQNIIDADTVVLEVVERSLSSGVVPLIQPAALAELEKSLAAHHR